MAILIVEDEYETMARSTGLVAVAVFVQQGEATGYDTIRGIESGHEGEEFFWVEETEEWRAPAVVAAEAAAEAGVAGEAVPALADGGGAREGGRLRGQAEKDVGEDVVVHVVQRRRRRKHPAFLRAHAGSGVEAAAGRRSEGRNVERE
jgi:hypothetical protein